MRNPAEEPSFGQLRHAVISREQCHPMRVWVNASSTAPIPPQTAAPCARGGYERYRCIPDPRRIPSRARYTRATRAAHTARNNAAISNASQRSDAYRLASAATAAKPAHSAAATHARLNHRYARAWRRCPYTHQKSAYKRNATPAKAGAQNSCGVTVHLRAITAVQWAHSVASGMRIPHVVRYRRRTVPGRHQRRIPSRSFLATLNHHCSTGVGMTRNGAALV